MKKFKSEAEFGQQVVEILRSLGFETWQEVYLGTGLGNPCIDIVARLGKVYFAFELKLHLNDDVLRQARRNRAYVDYSFVLVPNSCNITEVKKYFATAFGIGVYSICPDTLVLRIERAKKRDNFTTSDVLKTLYGSPNSKYFYLGEGNVRYNTARRITRRKKRKRKGKLAIETYLFEEQKECTAGTTQGGRTTPFRRSCAKIEEYLKENPGSSRKEVWEALKKELHWKSYNSMCGSFRSWHDRLDCMKNIVFGGKNERKKG